MTRPTVSRLDLLYDSTTLRHYNEEYGPPTEIKRHVKTTAKVYEIRTALRYWFGGQASHRTSDAVWYRLRAHDEDGLPPTECEQL